MSFTSVMDNIAMAFEALGAAVLVGGVVWSGVSARRTWLATGDPAASYQTVRRAFGASLLLGIEVLVAADLIRTVAVSPTLEGVLVLAIIVLIRTFLSLSLQLEIEGTFPWRRDRSVAPGTEAVSPSPSASTTVANPERRRHQA